MRTRITLTISLLALVAAGARSAEAPALGRFSTATAGSSLPASWERWLPAAPGKLTRWKLADLDGTTALRAIGNEGGGGVVHRLPGDLAAIARLSWRWRVLEHPSGADLSAAGKDDAAARVCALFGDAQGSSSAAATGLGSALPALTGEPAATSALCYAWTASGRSDTVLSLEEKAPVRNLVLEVGRKGQWTEERRDVPADYERVFGAPPGPLVAIGLLTDSDATAGSASAYFGDVELSAP